MRAEPLRVLVEALSMPAWLVLLAALPGGNASEAVRLQAWSQGQQAGKGVIEGHLIG